MPRRIDTMAPSARLSCRPRAPTPRAETVENTATLRHRPLSATRLLFATAGASQPDRLYTHRTRHLRQNQTKNIANVLSAPMDSLECFCRIEIVAAYGTPRGPTHGRSGTPRSHRCSLRSARAYNPASSKRQNEFWSAQPFAWHRKFSGVWCRRAPALCARRVACCRPIAQPPL